MSAGDSRRAVLALDVGTSSTRAMLFDTNATAIEGAEVHIKYMRRLAADGTAEVDVEHLFAKVVESVDRLLEQVGDSRRIEAVGISTFWHGLLGSARDGKAVTPLYLWSDSRSWREAEAMSRELDGEDLRQKTGCPVHPTYWPAKLRWLRRERPELWEQDTHWLSFGDLLWWRWFGVPMTSASIASGTGLTSLRTAPSWAADVLELVGLKPGALAEIGDQPGRLGSEFAARWPRLADIPWLLPAGDGALASLGTGCTEAHLRSVTIGTSGAVRVMSRDLPERLPAGLFCYRLDAETYVPGAASSNGGNLYEWLGKTLQLDSDADAAIAGIEPGSHGLSVLPLLAGERSLGFAPHATGAIAGLTLASRPEQIARAAMEAIAIELARYNRRIDETWRSAERLVGSGAALLKSPAWMQMVADATGVTLQAGAIPEASSRGAALLALQHLGEWHAGQEAVQVTATFEPNPEAHRVYRRATEKQEALYELLVAERLLDAPPRSAHLIHGRHATS
jgi:gluconokinase